MLQYDLFNLFSLYAKWFVKIYQQAPKEVLRVTNSPKKKFLQPKKSTFFLAPFTTSTTTSDHYPTTTASKFSPTQLGLSPPNYIHRLQHLFYYSFKTLRYQGISLLVTTFLDFGASSIMSYDTCSSKSHLCRHILRHQPLFHHCFTSINHIDSNTLLL